MQQCRKRGISKFVPCFQMEKKETAAFGLSVLRSGFNKYQPNFLIKVMIKYPPKNEPEM